MNPLALISQVAGVVALIACVLERRAPAGMPLVTLVRDRFGAPVGRPLLAAAGYGAFLVAAPTAAAVVLGFSQVRWAPGAGALALAVAAALVPVRLAWAGMEELIYRGALLPRAARLAGGAIGLLASAALFSWAHLERTGARTPDAWSLLGYALDGMTFALLFLETRRLWAPTVCHAAKNVVVGLIGAATVLPGGALLAVDTPRATPWVGLPGQSGWLDVIAVGLVVAWLLARRARALAADLAWVRGI